MIRFLRECTVLDEAKSLQWPHFADVFEDDPLSVPDMRSRGLKEVRIGGVQHNMQTLSVLADAAAVRSVGFD